jgi:metal-responsive CopG/Arc/MetJ family transcriptional regulator
MTPPKNFKVTGQLIARFTVCVEPALYNKLTEMARRKKMPRSELVRDILMNYIAERQARKDKTAEEPAHA